MGRFILVLIVVGGVLGFEGIKELVLSEGTTSEPQDVEIKDLERGNIPFNNHVRVGKHVAVYPAAVFQYEQSSWFSGEPDRSTKVNYCYYPIVSTSHPLLRRLERLKRQYRGLENVPENVPLTDSRNIAMLVKTRRFKTIGAIPFTIETTAEVHGVVTNKVSSLGGDEAKLIKESFPNLDLDRVLILDVGRTPTSLAASLGMICGGGVLILIGVGIFIMRMGGSSEGSGQLQHEEQEAAYSH